MFDYVYNAYQLFSNILIMSLLQHTLCRLFGKKSYTSTFTNYGLMAIVFWVLYYVPFWKGSLTDTLLATIPYYYYFIASILVSLIWAFVFVEGKMLGKVTYLLYFYSVYKCFKFIMGFLYNYKDIMDSRYYQVFDLLTYLIIAAGMYWLCVLFVKRPLMIFTQLKLHQQIMALFCPVSFFTLLQLADPSISVPYDIFISVSAVLLLINLPIIYYLYVTITSQYESKADLEKALAETSSQLTRFRYTVIAEEQARKERHEIKNTYFYIQALLHDGKYDQLAEYLSKHIGELDDSITGLHTGNLLIDHILNNKIAFARKNKIKIYTEVLIPEQLSINEEHFCTVLLNLLDNAIEASLKETDPDIWIIINIKNNNLICCIKNKVSRDVLENNPKLKTTKADAKNHGQGMRIIRRAVRRMNGIFDASVNNNYFVATVVIPVLSQENSQTPQP